jgi:dihydroneopterin aldolase
MTTKVETVAERIARLLKEKTAPVQEVTVSPTEMLDTN